MIISWKLAVGRKGVRNIRLSLKVP